MAANYAVKASIFDSAQRLFVAKDSSHVTRGVPISTTVDLAAVSVKDLRARMNAENARFDSAPFDPDGRLLRFYPGNVTVWSGFPGAGKTTLLRQFICQLLQAGRKVFFASLEEHPLDLLIRVMRTAAGTPSPTDHQMQWFLDAYGDQFRVWNSLGDSKGDDLLSAIASLKVEHAFIDSLMALDVSGYEWETQRLFAKKVINTSRISNAHIHLVAHPRKPMEADELPEVHHVAGSADLGRLVDNVIFVRRKPTEAAESVVTGMRIQVRKQRHHTGALASYEGWFKREQLQFSLDQFSKPMRYLPDDAYTAY
jgi:twinkle protein